MDDLISMLSISGTSRRPKEQQAKAVDNDGEGRAPIELLSAVSITVCDVCVAVFCTFSLFL